MPVIMPIINTIKYDFSNVYLFNKYIISIENNIKDNNVI